MMRNVTARELSRDTARLLDDVELEGLDLLVVRNGRSVARITPVEGIVVPGRGRPRSRIEVAVPSEATTLQLDDREREVLTRFGPTGFYTPRDSETHRLLLELEHKGVVVLDLGGHRLTRLGSKLKEAL